MCRLASARRCYIIQRTECELDSGKRVDSWEFLIFAPDIRPRARYSGGAAVHAGPQSIAG